MAAPFLGQIPMQDSSKYSGRLQCLSQSLLAEGGDNVGGSVKLRLRTGLPFPVLGIL